MLGAVYFGQVVFGGVPVAAAPSGTTYTYAGSGGAVAGGTSAAAREWAPGAAGGLTASGSAGRARGRAPVSAGGATVSGAAATAKLLSVRLVGSGGLRAGGAVVTVKIRGYQPTGGLRLEPRAGTDYTRPPHVNAVVVMEPLPWRRRRKLTVV